MALTLGSTGDEVKKLQQELRSKGYDIAVDGILGPKTMAAYNDDQSKQPKVDTPSAPTDRLSQAWADVRKQAAGLGISEDQIDQGYVQALASGKGEDYTKGWAEVGKKAPMSSPGGTYSGAVNTFGPVQPYQPKQRPAVSLADAMSRARSTLSPVYQQDVQDITEQLGYNMARRGMYGQPVSAEVVARGIAPRQAQYLSEVSRLAEALMQADRQAALQEQAQDYQVWQGNTNLALTMQNANRAALEAERQAAWDREQFDWTKQRDLASDQFSREQFDWQKQYQQAQLDLANQPKPAPVRTPKQQYEDTIFNKLLTGQTLTPAEQDYIGSPTGNPWLEAIKMAQGDDRWYAADPAVRKGVIDEYYALITGGYGGGMTGGPLADNSEDPDRKAGYLK